MNFIMTVCGYPFGWLMYGLYHLVSNYGVALVLFTPLRRWLNMLKTKYEKRWVP